MPAAYGKPVSIATIDIDHFKAINDTHGHDAGDVILRRTALILRDQTRGTDIVCRVGGEEFLIIFPSQTIQEAAVCAERCRAAIEATIFTAGGKDIRATISAGVATRIPSLPQFPDLLKVADQALYAAKNSGRNKICTGEQPANSANGNIGSTTMDNATTPSSAPLNMQSVLKRCGSDAKFAAALVDRFRNQAGGEVARLEAAITAGNAADIQRIAHSLKSMAAYVGADAPSELSRRIEELAQRNCLGEIPAVFAQLRDRIAQTIQWIESNSQTVAA